MSLRFRLNLIIAIICFMALLLGSVVTIVNARQSVVEEISSSLILAKKLVGQEVVGSRFSGLKKVRHLRIAIVIEGQDNRKAHESPVVTGVPRLFVQFVRPNLEQLSLWLEAEKSTQPIRLVADPSDEIREAWREAVVFIAFLLLLTLLISGCVFVVVGRALRPVDEILSAFVEIEKGDYQKRLDSFNLPEFARIAEGINHLSGKLAHSKAENRRLNKKALDVGENERRYLALELHDEMGQSLSAIKALSSSIKQRESMGATSLSKIEEICDHLFGVIRNRMRQLAPPLLVEFGLSVSIEELVDKWQGDSQMELNLDDSVDALVGANAIHFYRIIQESLTNILKHAQASKVWVKLNKIESNGEILIAFLVRDDGVGFNPKEVKWGGGLVSIKERIESLGGVLLIYSVLGKGTTLSATLQVDMQDE